VTPLPDLAASPPARLRALGATVRLSGRVDLARGACIAVVGPNGSGKTTLLRACAGLVRLAAGEVRLDDVPLLQVRRREAARLIALMPQHTDLQFPLSGLEAVLLGRSPHKHGLGLADAGDERLAEAAMRALDVWALADRPVTALSGGELQRLMLARVMVQQARFVLLDEPTSAQDPLGTLRVRDVLRGLTEDGAGVLAAVHDLNFALREFERVVVLSAGTVLFAGPAQGALESGALERAFDIRLRRIADDGMPYVVAERVSRAGIAATSPPPDPEADPAGRPPPEHRRS
jgi:iron complex transport system ATP-binding protein